MSGIRFREIYGEDPDFEIQVPGRTELGGNHTDHQHGKVLAAPVDLYIKAWVRKTDDGIIHFYSKGYDPFEIDMKDTSVNPSEYGKTASIVRGIANAFKEHGMDVLKADGLAGYKAYIVSDIPPGSGLSSSAALEILLGKVCCRLTGIDMSAVELARLGQFVENRYFGKPCGLMDQMACAADRIIAIDFRDPCHPGIKSVRFDLRAAGYSLCIISCGAGHEKLTENYAAIITDLSKICSFFGREALRDVPENDFYANISRLRKLAGDRAVLRAMHVYDENRRVEEQVKVLKANDIEKYLELVNESGESSWKLLQNVIPEGAAQHQEMAVALETARRNLGKRGAVRVHGGGFAGTLQAYVPIDMTEEFRKKMESVLGKNCCLLVNIV